MQGLSEKNKNYKLNVNSGYVRWCNRNKFIKKIFGSKKSNISFLIINFNDHKNIIKKIDSFNKIEGIDIIILENSYKLEERNLLRNYIEKNHISNISIIDTIENIGSAGGYALGLEYIFYKNYEWVLIIEDDVNIINEGTFEEMINNIGEKKIIYIKSPINIYWEHSWLVQIGLYPVEFLKKVGVPNPSYFTRSEDLEWKERFDRIVKKYDYKEIVVDKNYFHPYLKKNNGQTWWIYFSLRNHLYTTFKWFSLNKITYLITIFLYIWYSFSKLIIEKNNYIIKSVFFAILDFIKGDYSFENNKTKLEKFKNMNIVYPKNSEEFILNLEELNKITNDNYLIIDDFFSNVDREKIKYSKNIKNFGKYGVLIGGFFSILYPIFILSKNIVSINEYDFENNKYHLSIIKNSPKYIQIILSFIIALIVFIIILPLIILKGLIIYFTKYL